VLPENIRKPLEERIARSRHPKELVVDVAFAVQDHYGYLSDDAVEETARMLGISPLEVEELATFYTFLFREPVGKYVIHYCDSVICWMAGQESLQAHLSEKLGIAPGETTPDGLFTLLPICCIGYCDRAPAILVNRKVYGPLTHRDLDDLLETLKRGART
jgi:NADH-quinone oxidoreductase subunit E